MSFSFRVFLAFFALQLAVIYFISEAFMDEFRPVVHQSTEDAMVDMANLLAEFISDEFVSDEFSQENTENLSISKVVQRFEQRRFDALIYDIEKQRSSLRIYITDAHGIVVYDSEKKAVGEDYSRWNDVYLTLRGRYGARSTQSDPNDKYSSVMHVAAPVLHQGEIVGVLTVAKPNIKLQPFIDIARNAVQLQGGLIVLLALGFAILVALLLSRSVAKLVRYADAIAEGLKVPKPRISERELARLSDSIDNMRTQLDGKEYIENYVHSLTHELKSPVSAIRGAAELINCNMEPDVLARFSDNILNESQRIDDLVNRLLALVTVENMQELTERQDVELNALISKVLQSKQHQLNDKHIKISFEKGMDVRVSGDPLLLSQAIDNLLQNAIDFTPSGGEIAITMTAKETLQIAIADTGTGIPDYAKEKVFQRFYSLARPDSEKRSSGLGLCFVRQVAQLHRGDIELTNNDGGGMTARLILPV